jgi:hypothetical protein
MVQRSASWTSALARRVDGGVGRPGDRVGRRRGAPRRARRSGGPCAPTPGSPSPGTRPPPRPGRRRGAARPTPRGSTGRGARSGTAPSWRLGGASPGVRSAPRRTGGSASRTSARYASASVASKRCGRRPSAVPGRQRARGRAGTVLRLGLVDLPPRRRVDGGAGGSSGSEARPVAHRPPSPSRTSSASSRPVVGGDDAHGVTVVDRLQEPALHPAPLEPREPPPLGGGVGEVGVDVHAGDEAAAEAVPLGDVVVVHRVLGPRRAC